MVQFQSSGQQYYYTSANTTGGQHLSYVSSSNCNSCNQNTMPTSGYPSWHYGYADIEYRIRKRAGQEPTVTFGTETRVAVHMTSSDADGLVCTGDSVTLTGPSGYTNYQFLINAQEVQNGTKTSYSFAPAQGDQAQLKVTGSSGVLPSNTITFQVFEPALVKIGYQLHCRGSESFFFDSSQASKGKIKKYFWNFNDEGTDSVAHPKFVFPTGGIKKIVHKVWDSAGCPSVDTFHVVIKDTLISSFTVKGEGFSLEFLAHADSAIYYDWSFGDGNTANGKTAMHTFSSAGEYQVCLTLRNECGPNLGCRFIKVPYKATSVSTQMSGLVWGPNPATERLRWEWRGPAMEKKLEPVLMTLQGQQIGVEGRLREAIDGHELNLKGLPAGLYLLRTQSGEVLRFSKP